MELSLKHGEWAVVEGTHRVAGRPRLVRAAEWIASRVTRPRGGYFNAGIERSVCRAIYEAASRQTLYRFAPPPPFRLASVGRGVHADEYCFRSPFVSHLARRNEGHLRYYRRHGTRHPLLVLNPDWGRFSARVVERTLVRALLAAGFDVAVPTVPGIGRRAAPEDQRAGWAASVGGALSAIVQLVHDDVAIEAWARELGYHAVAASGIGIGGTAAAVLAATTTRFEAYVPMLAGAHPGRLWLAPRPLAGAVATRALARAGVRRRESLARLFDPVAPIRLAAPRARERCAVIGLRFDTVVRADDVRELAHHWNVAPRWLPRARVELPLCARDLARTLSRVAQRIR